MVTKRSVSLPDEVAQLVEDAARREGVSFSTWLAAAATSQLKLQEGLDGIARFEAAHGALSDEERTASDDVLHRILAGMGVRGSRSRRR